MQTKYKARFSLWREKWKILVAVFFLFAAITAFSEPENKDMVSPMLVLCGIVVVWILIDFLRYKLVVTETALKGTESVGLFGKSVTLPIKQISAIEISQKGLGRIFNYGTVMITTASGITAFKYVKSPKKVENAILESM